jgi:dipeptidyl aminopeptidase/acylaminoacyl peptidase
MAGGVRLLDVQWDSEGQSLVWLESRGAQGVLVCAHLEDQDAAYDLTSDLSVRARVGYGGGDFTVAHGSVFFAEQSGRLYRQPLGEGLARPITPAFGHAAAPAVSPDAAWVLYVHSYEEHDVLALVDAAGRQWPHVLIHGHDFYMQPCWHPGSKQIAYIAWNHPQMPWDGTLLYLAKLRAIDGMLVRTEVQMIAGGTDTAIFQPSFSPDGRWLAYISDETGWSNLYVYDLKKGVAHALTNVNHEHSPAAWIQGMRTHAWSHDSEHIYFLRNVHGFWRLYVQSLRTAQVSPVVGLNDYTALSQIACASTSNRLALLASSSTIPARVLACEPPQSSTTVAPQIIRRSRNETIPTARFASAQPISWQTTDGSMVHGLLYVPPETTTDQLLSSSERRPPAILKIHGGPTSQAVANHAPDVQFYTTRGYVVLLVNHRGSTGYGRAYMEALRGQWGVYDIEDTVSGARYLAAQGIADERRMVILGGSSGGYTVLETLCRAPGVFCAGLCLYGVTNMFTLAADTHKFEAHYLDSLLGPLPDASDIYRERSPLFHADLIRDPVAIFQGEDDRVVPRSQSDAIVAALRRSGVPHEYHVYPNEGHGWRRPETIEQFYTAVDAFLKQYVLFA